MNLVDLALAQPPGEREAYLRSACAGDFPLFDQVWHYVRWEERMAGFLLEPLYSVESAELAFDPGELLDGRFRIMRQVGEGGMGVVYEAADEKLGRRIAVKCAKSGFRKRLPPEVRHASEISHPNVCKIFEIHTAKTDRGEIDFFTMEFLEGETLTERLRSGKLPEPEARAIARQLSAGLAAAHRSQVIHGDLKSNNVILTKEATGGLRAVITDFGLASRTIRGGGPANRSASGVSGGTPDYMAPELWKGGKASAASDIYALGVICYEMLSGMRLDQPDAPWERRLSRKAPRVHPKWDRVIARCLEAEPSRRYRSPEEVGEALAPRSRTTWLAAAAAVALAAVTGLATYRSSAVPPRIVRLALLPFQTGAGTSALGKSLRDETVERLHKVKGSREMRLDVIPPGLVEQNKADTPEKAIRILGASHVFTVTMEGDGSRIRIRAAISDSGSLQLRQWEADFESDERRFIPSALAGIVTAALHLAPAAAPTAVNAAAAADFSAGVEMARRDDRLDGAIPLLVRAVSADADSPLTHARLAQALLLKYHLTGEGRLLEKARISLKSAEKRNSDTALVWFVSGMLGEYKKSYASAEAGLQRARELEPQNADVWRHLGGVYVGSARFQEAKLAYQKAVELDPGYFKNHQDLCLFYDEHDNYEEAVRQCEKAIELAPDFAGAHFTLARVSLDSGHYVEAEREAGEALRLNPKASNALQVLGIALADQGRSQDAIAYFRRAAEALPETEIAYSNLGSIYRLANQPDKAREAYRHAADLAQADLRRNLNDAEVRAHLAYVYARLGNRRDAEYEADQAWQLAPGSVNVAQVLVATYEALNERSRALEFASKAPPEALRRLKHDAQPDLRDLHQDRHFQQLLELYHIQ
jgi:tetratricopeptide (TPR) repeat protein